MELGSNCRYNWRQAILQTSKSSMILKGFKENKQHLDLYLEIYWQLEELT